MVHEYPFSTSALGKAAKKNQKRAEKRAKERAQKLKEDGVIDRLIHENEEVVKNVKTQDPVERLKTQLQEAKDNKVWYRLVCLGFAAPPGVVTSPNLEVDHISQSLLVYSALIYVLLHSN